MSWRRGKGRERNAGTRSLESAVRSPQDVGAVDCFLTWVRRDDGRAFSRGVTWSDLPLIRRLTPQWSLPPGVHTPGESPAVYRGGVCHQ